jgi:anti-anti-sigma factor
MTGLLYLEHNAATGAFSEVGIELLGLLSSQAAIAIEHAALVARVQAANERLEIELAERERAEREHAALQEQMIEAQRERLSEMSTPLIPITDRIVVIPLIGTVDSERAALVLEVALEGAQRHQARVVILDITGIKHVDTHVAGTLVKTASALRLVGAAAVLTGVRAEVAQTIVELGIDLRAMVTMGTLQSGIAYALKSEGGTQRRRGLALSSWRR